LNISATSKTASLRSFIDAAAEAVAREIASFRRESSRELELRDAEYRARVAELDARIIAVSALENKLADRIASLKDGEPGRDGRDGVDGKDGADGASVAIEDIAPMIMQEIEKAVSAIPLPKDGRDGSDGKDGQGVTLEDVAPMIRETVLDVVASIPIPKDGKDGIDGKDGERGAAGAPGKLPLIRGWTDRVHYEGDVVTHGGATYQAMRDTAKEPPHDDWICVAAAGNDGRSFTIRGTYSESEEYRALDVVAMNGASFAARRDAPGQCPGDGWQLIAAQGKRGQPGERGVGLRGEPGPTVARMDVDGEGLLTITNADGSTVQCDLYDVLSKLK